MGLNLSIAPSTAMAPMKAMKAMKGGMKGGKPMSKGALAQALADGTEVKKVGKCTIPGLCMIKTRLKPATKAGKKEIFGKLVMVKAKPAKTIVKAFAVAALKKSV